jgi:hypothetical protein
LFGAYATNRTAVSIGAAIATTSRYLDPPIEENYTNDATTAYGAPRLQRELNSGVRIGVIFRHSDSDFLVPNERVQHVADQRQQQPFPSRDARLRG